MTDYKYLDKITCEFDKYGIEELQSLNKSLWYAYLNGTITLEEYIRIKRSIASCLEEIEK